MGFEEFAWLTPTKTCLKNRKAFDVPKVNIFLSAFHAMTLTRGNRARKNVASICKATTGQRPVRPIRTTPKR